MDFWTWTGQYGIKPQYKKPEMPMSWVEMVTQKRYHIFNAERFRLYIFLAPGHQRITRPVLWVWGFDPASTRRIPEDFFLLINGTWTDSDETPDPGASLIEALWARGFDVLVLVPHDTTVGVSYNAEGLAHCLRLLRDGRDIEMQEGVPVPANVVIGISMGGIIARWALLSLERNGEAHNTQLYFSYDSPHRGANIPLSVQYFLDYFHKTELGVPIGSISAKRDILNSHAARELAIYHFDAPAAGSNTVNRWESQTRPQPHPFRRMLVSGLEAMGNHPLTRERRFAISNGGAGVSQGATPGQELLHVKIGPLGTPGAIFKALPRYDEASAGVDVATCWSPFYKWTAHVKVAHPLDTAPGSTGSFIKDVRTNLANTFGPVAHINNGFHEQVCFVPVTSALDIGDDVANAGLAPGRRSALPNFGDYFVNADRSESHVRVTREIQDFILEKLEAWQ